MKKYLLLALASLFFPFAAGALTLKPFYGHWSGSLETEHGQQRVSFDVTRAGEIVHFKTGKYRSGDTWTVHLNHSVFHFKDEGNRNENFRFLGNGEFSHLRFEVGPHKLRGYTQCRGDIRLYRHHDSEENDYGHWIVTWTGFPSGH